MELNASASSNFKVKLQNEHNNIENSNLLLGVKGSDHVSP